MKLLHKLTYHLLKTVRRANSSLGSECVIILIRSLSGRTGGGDGVFLGKFLEGDFLGLLDGCFLLHDGMLDGLLFGDHRSHSVVLLLERLSEELNFVGLSGGLLGKIVNVFLLNRDGVGAGSLLGDLLLQEFS